MTIVVTAGGTGGHLFPAQALAEAMIDRGRTIVVMTDTRGARYAHAFPGADIMTVPAAQLSGNPVAKLAALGVLACGVAVALVKLLALRPAAVIGFGGYPTLPVMIAACLARFPTAILEQNAVMGRANRAVMNRVGAIACAFPLVRFLPRDPARVRLTGNPLRPDVLAQAGAPYLAPQPGGALNLLVFGGSQGARVFADIVPAAIARLSQSDRARLRVTQQARPEDVERVRAAYAKSGIAVDIAPFFNDLPARMAQSQLVVARSGAGTVSELMAIGRPAILVPLPHALDDNQTPNADMLADAGAGWRVAQEDFTPETLATRLSDILADPASLAARAAMAHALARLDATARLADMVESVAGPAQRSAA